LLLDGTTNNGVITYDSTTEGGTVESNMTFDGTYFKITGSTDITGSLETTGSVAFAFDGEFTNSSGPSAWTTSNSLATARKSLAGAGTQNAGLAIGGRAPGTVRCVEEYNGNAWGAGGALPTPGRQQLAGAGEQNAALAFGGFGPTTTGATSEYNGASWSPGGTMSTARRLFGGSGNQNAALAVGGFTPSIVTCTEEYNGASWGTGGPLPSSRWLNTAVGSQNAALTVGGCSPSATLSDSQEYNGISWTAGGSLTTGRYYGAGAGTQNEAIYFGGASVNDGISCTEEYDGTSWTAGGALNTARREHGGAGIKSAGLAFGGAPTSGPSQLSCTEEYSQPETTVSGSFTTFKYSQTDGDIEATGSFDINLNRVDSTAGTFSIQGLPSDTTSTDHLVINSNGIVGKGIGNFNGATLAGPIYRSVDSVSIVNDTASFDFSNNDNFVLTADQDYKFDWVVTSDNVGQSGTIVINNTADATPDTLPSITKTPDGADILFVTGSGTTSVLSYYVAATDKVLVSYIGNFA